MLCEKCGKETATTHIRSVVNGKVYENHLCSYCAKAGGYISTNNTNLTQILSNVLGESELSNEKEIARCDCCGNTFADIIDSGKCGCSECYTRFYEQLLPHIKRVQGSTKHTGKIITYIDNQNDFKAIDELNDLLKKLITEENYEQAAVIRDKIKKLKEDKL